MCWVSECHTRAQAEHLSEPLWIKLIQPGVPPHCWGASDTCYIPLIRGKTAVSGYSYGINPLCPRSHRSIFESRCNEYEWLLTLRAIVRRTQHRMHKEKRSRMFSRGKAFHHSKESKYLTLNMHLEVRLRVIVWQYVFVVVAHCIEKVMNCPLTQTDWTVASPNGRAAGGFHSYSE